MEKPISTISRALILDGQLSLAVLDTASLVQEAANRHHLKGDALTVLGNTLTAAGYLSSWLKGAQSSLTISILSEGDFGRVSVLGDGNLNLRGYVENAACESGRLGKGTLSVVRDDRQGLPFAGTVPLVSEEIAPNFAAYFSESEQIQTEIVLALTQEGERVVHAGGVILQALPFASDEARSRMQGDAAQLKKLLLAGEYSQIFDEFGVQKTDTREVRFACSCSEERVESLLMSMGKEQALALLKEEGQISVHCEYCNKDYVFGQARIRKLFKKHE